MTGARSVLPNFLSVEKCKELEFIHRSCSVVGYRPYVLSTTLSHLIATNSAQLIMPFVAIREKLKEAVEEHFGCEFELFVEFTGLISWTRGARIGWHSDSNKPYLKQRHYSAVCYLNNHGKEFEGGLFHFQEGDPLTLVPSIGSVVIYTADEQNIHCVDEVTRGERCTLAMWFTRDQLYNEDVQLIKQLLDAAIYSKLSKLLERGTRFSSSKSKLCPTGQEENVCGNSRSKTKHCEVIPPRKERPMECVNLSENEGILGIGTLSYRAENGAMKSSTTINALLPKAASSTMYWFVGTDELQLEATENKGWFKPSSEELPESSLGNNICELRLRSLGFKCYEETDISMLSAYNLAKVSSCGSVELGSRLMLKFKEEQIPYRFESLLHASSVVQYFFWRKSMTFSLVGATLQPSIKNTSTENLDRKSSDQAGEFGQPGNELHQHSVLYGASHEIERKIVTPKTVFYQQAFDVTSLDIPEFLVFIQHWEEYISDLWMALSFSLPHWNASSCIFNVELPVKSFDQTKDNLVEVGWSMQGA